MYTLADLNKKYTNQINGKTEIVLMVNNKDALSQKLKAAKQQYPGLIKETYGITDKVDVWFQSMLYELKNSDSIETFLHNTGHDPKLKPSLNLRFHQLLITRSTMEYFKEGYKKFIWGAVPRSGKSYMIGGLISLRNIKQQFDHNIVLILGAKTETQDQFKDMFETLDDFKEYNIVIPGINEIEKDKNIYLFSQEYLKDKINLTIVNKKINQDETIFNDLFNFKELKSCKKKIDLYFDEIHKGGSTDRSESILYAFKNICKGIKPDRYSIIDLFKEDRGLIYFSLFESLNLNLIYPNAKYSNKLNFSSKSLSNQIIENYKSINFLLLVDVLFSRDSLGKKNKINFVVIFIMLFCFPCKFFNYLFKNVFK
jgi:hypothetical protein